MNNDTSSPKQHQSPQSSSKSNTGRAAKNLKHQNSSNYQNKMSNTTSSVINQMLGTNIIDKNALNNSVIAVDKGEHWNDVEKTKGQIEDIIGDLDKKLNRVLAKQEYEYLKGYNIYVKRKEKELRELIEKLNEKNSNNTLKDEKINNLERTIHAIREDQIKQEKEKEQQAEKIKYWKTKALGYEQEKNFLQQQIMDAKRQNKLLKLAIGRLQNELERKDEEQPVVQDNVKTFLTENMQQVPEFKQEKLLEVLRGDYYAHGEGHVINYADVSQFIDGTTAQTSLLDGGLSKLSAEQRKKLQQRRVLTRSPQSRYRHIPTENIKFQKFLELIFKSKMTREDIKDEIGKYVQALETNYTDSIKELKVRIEREKIRLRKTLSDKVNNNTEKNELESMFVDCIEEVRKDIMKRRLKNEIYNKKKFQQIEKSSDEAKEFEESLLKLAQLAKNRIKVSDFTTRDKCNLLDLFVNNEKTLLKIYEALFPHRAATQQSSMLNPQVPQKEKSMTAKNNLLSNMLSMNQYLSYNNNDNDAITAADTKFEQKFPAILPTIRGGGGDLTTDQYNNTMVEFGSIRQSVIHNNAGHNSALDNSYNAKQSYN